MSGAAFQIFHKLFVIGTALLYTVILTAFIKPFLMEGRPGRRRTATVFSALLICHLFCSLMPVPRGSLSLMLLALLFAASHALDLKRSLLFLLLILYLNAKITSSLLIESLQFVLGRLLPIKPTLPETIYLHSAIMITVLTLSHAAVLTIMLYALQRQIRKRHIKLHWRELCYVGLIPTAGILFGQIVSYLLLEIKDGIPLELYDRHPAFVIVVPLLALLFYIGSYLTITFQQGMDTLREEQETYFVEYQQTKALRERIAEVEQFYSRIRQMEHEMRNHLTNIQALAQNGQYEHVEDYIAHMDENMNGFDLTLQTGNAVTDVIVNDKRRQCLGLGIDLQADFHYPASGQYDAFDLGTILHNLLQNAIEACEKVVDGERYITLSGKQRGRFFLIKATNPFAGEVRFGENHLPVTTKTEDAPMHGIGLSNVRREAEKYMGELELKTDKQKFYATVLLQERSNI